MLKIRDHHDYRLPLSVVAFMLVLINAGLIGADIYMQERKEPFIASFRDSAKDTASKTKASPSAAENTAETKEGKGAAWEDAANSSTSNKESSSPEPVRAEVEPQPQPPSPAPIAASEPRPEPGRGGGYIAPSSGSDVTVAPSKEGTVTITSTPSSDPVLAPTSPLETLQSTTKSTVDSATNTLLSP